MCRSNFHGRASKNNKFNLPRKLQRRFAFVCLYLWHKKEHGSAKNKFADFACLSAKIAAALRR
ncbi:MAG: hypothetical protein DBX61_09965 [Clostridiales bacterium]|nr:MAG: hypothetical protein DBX61_09965 [Clostridiales bacterium]